MRDDPKDKSVGARAERLLRMATEIIEGRLLLERWLRERPRTSTSTDTIESDTRAFLARNK